MLEYRCNLIYRFYWYSAKGTVTSQPLYILHPINWPCVLDLFEYQILSATFHYVLNESCRDFFFIVIANWIHVSVLAYETIAHIENKESKVFILCKHDNNRKNTLLTHFWKVCSSATSRSGASWVIYSQLIGYIHFMIGI